MKRITVTVKLSDEELRAARVLACKTPKKTLSALIEVLLFLEIFKVRGNQPAQLSPLPQNREVSQPASRRAPQGRG